METKTIVAILILTAIIIGLTGCDWFEFNKENRTEPRIITGISLKEVTECVNKTYQINTIEYQLQNITLKCAGTITVIGKKVTCTEYIEENQTDKDKIICIKGIKKSESEAICERKVKVNKIEIREEETCKKEEKIDLEYENGDKYRCDYEGWWKCTFDNQTMKAVCDSKFDGNGDGICTAGETCQTIDLNDKPTVKPAKMYDGLRIMDEKEGIQVKCSKI